MIHSARLGHPGGKPAVLVHSFLGHSGAWTRLVAALRVPLDARVFDLPGHGRSDPWDGQGDLPAEVAGLIGRFARDRAILVGHSFGGAAALRFAIEQPARVGGLVLIEPVVFAAARNEPEYDAYRDTEVALHEAFAANDMHEAGRVFLALNGEEGTWDALPVTQQALIAEQMPMVAANIAGMHDDSAGVLAPGRPERFDRPVLLLDGANSPPIFGAINLALARRLPRARRVTLRGAAHMLPITHSGAVAAEIDAWIASELDSEVAEKPETRAG